MLHGSSVKKKVHILGRIEQGNAVFLHVLRTDYKLKLIAYSVISYLLFSEYGCLQTTKTMEIKTIEPNHSMQLIGPTE